MKTIDKIKILIFCSSKIHNFFQHNNISTLTYELLDLLLLDKDE